MRFAVIGAGALGGYFGGRLARSGHDVHFVARGDNLAALLRSGLQVRSVTGDFVVAPASASAGTADVGEVDAVLLGVKTWQLDSAIDLVHPLMGPDTVVVTMQNGVEAPDQVAQAVGRQAVLPGAAKIFATLTAPGEVTHFGGPGSLTFGEWDGALSPRAGRLRSVMENAGITAVVSDDITAALWEKFLFVVPFGGLGAVTNSPIGVLRSRPGTRALLRQGMEEICAVARARSVRLADDAVARALEFTDALPAQGRTSLQRDLLSGRPSELRAWNGAVVRLGEHVMVPTPVNRFLYEVLSAFDPRDEQEQPAAR
jgi:2-dehydropantoate 2-reductase